MIRRGHRCSDRCDQHKEKKEEENTRPVTYPTRHDIGAHSPHPSTVRRPACSDISRPSRPLFSPSPLIAHSPKPPTALCGAALFHTPLNPAWVVPWEVGTTRHVAEVVASNGPFQNRIHSPPPPLLVRPPACSLARSPPTGSCRIKVVGFVWGWRFGVGVYVCACAHPPSVSVCLPSELTPSRLPCSAFDMRKKPLLGCYGVNQRMDALRGGRCKKSLETIICPGRPIPGC